MQNKKCVLLKNIGKTYGKRTVLDQIDLSMNEGEIFGLLGPSGCGKSTTVKIIAGIERADSGSVEIFGDKMPNLKVMGKIGYMAQAAALYPTLSGYENLVFFGRIMGLKRKELEQRISELAELVQLEDALKKPVCNYSGGMKQRLSLIITLIAKPKLLLLDEPTVGIDPLLRQKIWEELYRLKEKGTTILVTTHVMDEVAKCDRLAMIREGNILVQGTVEEIQELANTSNIEDAFILFSRKQDESEGI